MAPFAERAAVAKWKGTTKTGRIGLSGVVFPGSSLILMVTLIAVALQIVGDGRDLPSQHSIGFECACELP